MVIEIEIKIQIPIHKIKDKYIVQDKVLLFDIESIKELRYKYGIVGILTGTLPSSKQQNTFLSVPLELMIEEALWLYTNNICDFEFILTPFGHLPTTSSSSLDTLSNENDENPIDQNIKDIIKSQKQNLLDNLQKQYNLKKQENINKAIKLGLSTEQLGLSTEQLGLSTEQLDLSTEQLDLSTEKVVDPLIKQSLFIYTPTLQTTPSPRYEQQNQDSESHTSIQKNSKDFNIIIKDLLETHKDNLKLYTHLKETTVKDSTTTTDNISNTKKKEYSVLLPGSRFGGKYVLYPGDPLRYHSHLIVKSPLNENDIGNNDIEEAHKTHIDLLQLVCDGRLSTNVKKSVAIPFITTKNSNTEIKSQSKKKTDLQIYTVEWSGFG